MTFSPNRAALPLTVASPYLQCKHPRNNAKYSIKAQNHPVTSLFHKPAIIKDTSGLQRSLIKSLSK